MGKAKKTIKALKAILSNPWLLNKVLEDNSVWEGKIRQSHNINDPLPIIPFGQLCTEESHHLEPWAFLDGSSLPTDIALLKSLAAKFSNCRYFEIGTWRGESAANVASVAKECFTLNLAKEQIMALGYDEKYADLHAYFSKPLANVTHLHGDSRDFDLSQLGKFDVIFIDGNHTYDFVANDTRRVFENLVHENTIVVWHDYAYSPERPRFEVMAGILEGTPKSLHKHLYQVSNTMCCVLMRSEVKARPFEPHQTPEQSFALDFRLKKT